jgi:hypothetical protein
LGYAAWPQSFAQAWCTDSSVLSSRHVLQVTEAGDLIYSVPRDVQAKLLLHNTSLRREENLRKASAMAKKVANFGFAGAHRENHPARSLQFVLRVPFTKAAALMPMPMSFGSARY